MLRLLDQKEPISIFEDSSMIGQMKKQIEHKIHIYILTTIC